MPMKLTYHYQVVQCIYSFKIIFCLIEHCELVRNYANKKSHCEVEDHPRLTDLH
jgi:hypothetical protein